jgi:hypothetical protein
MLGPPHVLCIPAAAIAMPSTRPSAASALRRPSLPALARGASLALLLGLPALAGAQAPAPAPAPAPAAAIPSDPTARVVRPEVGMPLQAAQTLINEGKPAEALAKLAEAEAVPNRTPWETWIIERTRASTAQRAGNVPLTIRALEAALQTGQADSADELQLVEVLVTLSLRERDSARVLRWAQRYEELKGPNDGVRVMRIQAMADSGDEEGAKRAMAQRVEAAEKAGQATPESHLRLLLSLQYRSKDPGSTATLERLVGAYPRPEYWTDLVSAASRTPNLSDRALLELYRLLRVTGAKLNPDMRTEMAQLALRAGQPAEAQQLVDEGFADGSLGTGSSAAEHTRLRDQVRRAAAADAADAAARRAPDGTALADLGFAKISALAPGAPASAVLPGLELMEQGVAKGGLKRASEIRLHLGIAQLAAGRKDAAQQTLKALAGQAGSDPLAPAIRLWSLYASAPAMLPPRQ